MMYYFRFSTTLLVVVTLKSTPQLSDGFSIPSVVPYSGSSLQSKMDFGHGMNTERRQTVMFGILDDIMEEDASDDQQLDEDVDERHVELYHSLIFSSNLHNEISNRLDACTDPAFLEYLSASAEASRDEEERQGLTELIEKIEQVKVDTAKKAEEEKEKAAMAAQAREEEKKSEEAEAPVENTKPLSNADILRKASEIDAAIALSDDEKPSDFISDCREVVNLSRGFNDSGQMRVGGS